MKWRRPSGDIAVEADPIAAQAASALRVSAAALGLDAQALADELADGLLTEIVLELQIATYLSTIDQDRLRELRTRIQRCRAGES